MEQGSLWPLMARESELEAFSAAWANRRSQGVVIFGPAGVGKSRLAEECLARAVHKDFRGGRVRASAAAAAVPLGAVAHLIPAGVDLSDPVKGFGAVARVLAGPQRDRRWAVLVDDLHLLDAASAVLLRQLLDAGVARLIGTVRSGEPVGDAVAALTGGDAMHRIDLTAFDAEQMEALLRAALGAPMGRCTLHELYMASGGNVLYLRELVLGAMAAKTLASDGEIWELTEGTLPTTPKLTDLIAARLAAAPPDARPVLELLALCEPVPLADGQVVALPGALAGLEAAGLLQAVTERRRTTLALAHPLYGEVLRAGLPVLRRRELLLAQAARTQAHGARRREDALHLATWRLAATGTADAALLIQAAALARHAHDYQQVVALLEAVPEQHHSTMTRVMLAEALWELAEPRRAEEVLLVAEARAQGEQERLSVTFTRSVNWFWGSSRVDQALAVIESAARQMRSSDSHRVLRTIEGWIRIMSGQPAEGLVLLEGLDADAHHIPDINAWLWGAIMKTEGLALVGRAVEGVTFAEHAYTTHMRLDKEAVVPHPSTQLLVKVMALAEAGRLAEARAVGERAFTDFVAARAPMPRVWMAFHLGRTEYLAGHPAAARRWYAEAAALARDLEHVRIQQIALSGLAASAALLGDLDTAQQARTEAAAHPAMGYLAGEEQLADAWLHAAHGRLAQARSILTEAAATARRTGHATSEALLLTDVARLDGAKEAAPRLVELAEHCQGTLAPARAHLANALAAGDPGQLLTSAAELETIGADLLAAEAATTAAAAWRRAGQTRRATSAVQQAQTIAARCEGARTPLLASGEAAAALTPREREIALLAAVGTSSKDIAKTLHLSVRTIDNHLQHAYAKLGVTTRRELAHTLGAKPTLSPVGRG